MSVCMHNSFQTGSLETSVSGSQISEPGTSENDPTRGSQSVQNVSTVEFHQAQRLISLFFALCTKVCTCFDTYYLIGVWKSSLLFFFSIFILCVLFCCFVIVLTQVFIPCRNLIFFDLFSVFIGVLPRLLSRFIYCYYVFHSLCR